MARSGDANHVDLRRTRHQLRVILDLAGDAAVGGGGVQVQEWGQHQHGRVDLWEAGTKVLPHHRRHVLHRRGRIAARGQLCQFIGARHVDHADAAHVLLLLAGEGRWRQSGHAAHDPVRELRALLGRHIFGAREDRQSVDADDAADKSGILLRDRQRKRAAEAMPDQHRLHQFARRDQLVQRLLCLIEHIPRNRGAAIETGQRHHIQHMIITEGADRVLPHPASTCQPGNQDHRRSALAVALHRQRARLEALGRDFSRCESVARFRRRVLGISTGPEHQCEKKGGVFHAGSWSGLKIASIGCENSFAIANASGRLGS